LTISTAQEPFTILTIIIVNHYYNYSIPLMREDKRGIKDRENKLLNNLKES